MTPVLLVDGEEVARGEEYLESTLGTKSSFTIHISSGGKSTTITNDVTTGSMYGVTLNHLMWTDYMDYIFTDDFDSYEEACHMASRLGEYSLFAISISDFLTNSIYVGIGTNDLNFDLLKELEQIGVKYNPNDIVAITKTADGKLVWLENGNANAGLNHILTHADQFVDKGIPRKNISDFIMHALENGKIVGHQRTRPIYEVMYNGKLQRVAISIGDNGFIVGANSKSIS